MDAKWTPRRAPYTPDWVKKRSDGGIYGEQQSEYAAYAKLQVGEAVGGDDLGTTELSPDPPSAAPASHGGKGFGGGEATRDPEPTVVDPNDPKGKQQAIHAAESFAEYLAKREAL